MDKIAFEASLKADGFSEIEVKTYEPRPLNGEHGHHFSVRGLVLEGAFTVHEAGAPTTYRPGQSFAVPEGGLHSEEIGPEGAVVLIGKKY